MRDHARKHGLPGKPRLLLDVFLTGGVLPEDVATSMNDRVRNFDAEFRRAHGGGGLTGVAQQIGAMARCIGPNVMPTTRAEVLGLWGPLLRVMLPYRGICQLSMGKVGHHIEIPYNRKMNCGKRLARTRVVAEMRRVIITHSNAVYNDICLKASTHLTFTCASHGPAPVLMGGVKLLNIFISTSFIGLEYFLHTSK
jgi:hypothetical protein